LASKKGWHHKVVTPGTFLSINHLITKNIQGTDEKSTEEDTDTKQPLQEPTQAPFSPLSWRAQGTVSGSLKDSKTGPNTIEASNRPRQTNILKT
jgi:hypothetical protein